MTCPKVALDEDHAVNGCPAPRMKFKNLNWFGSISYQAVALLAAGLIFATGILQIPAAATENLIKNGGFEIQSSPTPGSNSAGAAGWKTSDETANASQQKLVKACVVSSESPHSGKECFLLQRTGARSNNFTLAQPDIPFTPGRIYRLRFWAKADARAKEMAAICFNSSGPE